MYSFSLLFIISNLKKLIYNITKNGGTFFYDLDEQTLKVKQSQDALFKRNEEEFAKSNQGGGDLPRSRWV